MKLALCLAVMLPSSLAAAQAPRPRVTPDMVLSAIRRHAQAALDPLGSPPTDTAGAAALADRLEHTSDELTAKLVPELRSAVNMYAGATRDVAKLRIAAAAVRVLPPCATAVNAVLADEATKSTTPAQLTAEIATARTACEALDAAAPASEVWLDGVHAPVRAGRGEIRDLEARIAVDTRVRAEREKVERAEAAIAATTVMGRFPEFTLDDAYRPEKVAEAFAKMPPELIVSAPAMLAHATVERFPGDNHASCKSGAGKDFSSSWYHNGAASMAQMIAPASATAGVPMLVWSRGASTIFVTIDGIHYDAAGASIPYDLLVKGVPPRAQWPTAPRDICIDGDGLALVVEHQLASPAVIAKYQAADDALAKCIQRAWSSGDAAFDANDRANVTASTRANRYDALLDSGKSAVERACDGQRRVWQAAVVALSRDAAKPRVDLLVAATKALDAALATPVSSAAP